MDIKGFDHKSAPKPDKYNGNINDFHVWQDLFVATLTALDPQWQMILKEVEGMEEEIIRAGQEEVMKNKWGIVK